jgi:hypothetical protein
VRADQVVPQDWINFDEWHLKYVDGLVEAKTPAEIAKCYDADSDMFSRVQAYAVQRGFSGTTVMPGVTANSVLIIADDPDYIAYWGLIGITKPAIDDLPTVADAKAYLESVHQASKSELHKMADNAMIATLIMGGLMPTGTVSLAEGTTDAITMQLLTIEMADPTNAFVQVIGTKLDKIKTIIMNAGGTADDAIVHVLPGE